MKRLTWPATLISLALVLYFQNCANDTSVLVLSSSAPEALNLPPLPIDHPAEKAVRQTEIKYQVVNRGYVSALIKDIFSTGDDSELPVAWQNHLDKWIEFKGGQYGMSCDMYESPSGRDCRFQEDLSNGPVFVDHNTVRESYQIQFCNSILSINEALNNALTKISAKDKVPNRELIIQAYHLFYRGDDPNTNTVNSLLDLDRSLAQNKETAVNRWRVILTQICETPGWHLF